MERIERLEQDSASPASADGAPLRGCRGVCRYRHSARCPLVTVLWWSALNNSSVSMETRHGGSSYSAMLEGARSWYRPYNAAVVGDDLSNSMSSTDSMLSSPLDVMVSPAPGTVAVSL